MIRRSVDRRVVFALLALVVLVVVAATITSRYRAAPPPASPAVLEHIADKNEKAATDAAARQKIESEQAAEAADRAVEANEARP